MNNLSSIKKIRLFSNSKKISLVLLGLILILAAFLRFYGNDLDHKFHFTNDEARDALFIKNSIDQNKPIALGPEITSIGGLQAGVHLGPFYYYLLTFAHLIGDFNPYSGEAMVILFSLASVILIYWVGQKLYSPQVGLIAALVLAISKILIEYNWAWNPNPLPFFVLLYVLLLYNFLMAKKEEHWVYLCLVLGLMTQLHLVAGIFLITTLMMMLLYRRWFGQIKYFLLGMAAFVLTYFPFLIYELTHQWRNTRGYLDILLANKTPVTAHFFDLDRALGLLSFFNNDFFTSQKSQTLSFLIIVGIVYYLWKTRQSFPSRLILLSFTLLFLFLAKLQNLNVYWHYILPFLPFLVLGFSNFLKNCWQNKNILTKIGAGLILILVIYFNLNTYVKWINDYQPVHAYDMKYKNIVEVVDYIVHDSEMNNFQLYFANWPTQNDLTYQYLFKLKHKTIDQQAEITYAIIQPKTFSFDIPTDKKMIWDKEIGDIRIIKMSN